MKLMEYTPWKYQRKVETKMSTDKAYTLDNVNEWVEDLAKRPKTSQFMTYATYSAEANRRARQKEISDLFKNAQGVHLATMVTEDIAVVEQIVRGKVAGYFAVVNDKPSFYMWPTFDEALMCAMSIKYSGNEDATKYIIKMLK